MCVCVSVCVTIISFKCTRAYVRGYTLVIHIIVMCNEKFDITNIMKIEEKPF